MKSRLATYMNLGRRILVSTLLAVIVTATAGAQSAPAVSSAEARKAIQVGYAEWAKARMALDMYTIERMLAPDFYFQSPDQKHTRQEFIDSMPSLKITRFDASVLTVEPRGNDWAVLIFEKVEVETKDKNGKTSKGYRLLVAGWLEKIERQPMDPLSHWASQRSEGNPPITNWFSSDVLHRSRFLLHQDIVSRVETFHKRGRE